jgi:hypothetical protein
MNLDYGRSATIATRRSHNRSSPLKSLGVDLTVLAWMETTTLEKRGLFACVRSQTNTGGGNRTHTGLPPEDFMSPASADPYAGRLSVAPSRFIAG